MSTVVVLLMFGAAFALLVIDGIKNRVQPQPLSWFALLLVVVALLAERIARYGS